MVCMYIYIYSLYIGLRLLSLLGKLMKTERKSWKLLCKLQNFAMCYKAKNAHLSKYVYTWYMYMCMYIKRINNTYIYIDK